jgi:glutathione peroxidase-family protein
MSRRPRLTAPLMIFAMMCLFVSAAHAADKAAPDFSLTSSDGKVVKLSDYKGKTIVLEWLNHGCPFVKKHYTSGNMQAIQKAYTAKGVIWLSIISSAPGKQGHSTPEIANADRKRVGSAATAILIDENGAVGKLYEAKTTPNMLVISGPDQQIQYSGAIDDNPSFDPAVIPASKNLVKAALDSVLAGQTVAVPTTASYGCSVKY